MAYPPSALAYIPLFILGLSLCLSPAAAQSEPPSERLRQRVEVTSARGGMVAAGETLRAPAGIVDFYQRRGFALAWFEGSAPTDQAMAMVRVIEDAKTWGLTPATYHAQALLSHPGLKGRRGRFNDIEQVDFDLLLTDAWLTLARHLVMGRVSAKDIDKDILLVPRELDFPQSLEAALAGPGAEEGLVALHPKDADYHALLSWLAYYREVESSGGWGTVAPGEATPADARGPQIPALKARLRATGDLTSTATKTDEDLLDAATIEGLKSFQSRHGLSTSGTLDEPTLAALNVPIAERIEAISLNLERWRWLPQELGPKHIRVNIPAFGLELREGDETALAMKVIVGRAYRQTPMFSSLISYIVLNPTWTVPPNIAAQDKFPLIKKDPSYLARNKMILLEGYGPDTKVVDPATVNWSAMTASQFNKRYRIQQSPGPHNALGQVKFMFPNAYNVYLHDTNARELFDKDERSISSGCIRLSQPLDLARLLLKGQAEGAPGAIEKALKGGRESSIILKEKMPVHLMYFTAWPKGESLEFRQDLYGRDARLKASLAKIEGTTS